MLSSLVLRSDVIAQYVLRYPGFAPAVHRLAELLPLQQMEQMQVVRGSVAADSDASVVAVPPVPVLATRYVVSSVSVVALGSALLLVQLLPRSRANLIRAGGGTAAAAATTTTTTTTSSSSSWDVRTLCAVVDLALQLVTADLRQQFDIVFGPDEAANLRRAVAFLRSSSPSSSTAAAGGDSAAVITTDGDDLCSEEQSSGGRGSGRLPVDSEESSDDDNDRENELAEAKKPKDPPLGAAISGAGSAERERAALTRRALAKLRGAAFHQSSDTVEALGRLLSSGGKLCGGAAGQAPDTPSLTLLASSVASRVPVAAAQKGAVTASAASAVSAAADGLDKMLLDILLKWLDELTPILSAVPSKGSAVATSAGDTTSSNGSSRGSSEGSHAPVGAGGPSEAHWSVFDKLLRLSKHLRAVCDTSMSSLSSSKVD